MKTPQETKSFSRLIRLRPKFFEHRFISRPRDLAVSPPKPNCLSACHRGDSHASKPSEACQQRGGGAHAESMTDTGQAPSFIIGRDEGFFFVATNATTAREGAVWRVAACMQRLNMTTMKARPVVSIISKSRMLPDRP